MAHPSAPISFAALTMYHNVDFTLSSISPYRLIAVCVILGLVYRVVASRKVRLDRFYALSVLIAVVSSRTSRPLAVPPLQSYPTSGVWRLFETQRMCYNPDMTKYARAWKIFRVFPETCITV